MKKRTFLLFLFVLEKNRFLQEFCSTYPTYARAWLLSGKKKDTFSNANTSYGELGKKKKRAKHRIGRTSYGRAMGTKKIFFLVFRKGNPKCIGKYGT
jgi:hypothetical protein